MVLLSTQNIPIIDALARIPGIGSELGDRSPAVEPSSTYQPLFVAHAGSEN